MAKRSVKEFSYIEELEIAVEGAGEISPSKHVELARVAEDVIGTLNFDTLSRQDLVRLIKIRGKIAQLLLPQPHKGEQREKRKQNRNQLLQDKLGHQICRSKNRTYTAKDLVDITRSVLESTGLSTSTVNVESATRSTLRALVALGKIKVVNTGKTKRYASTEYTPKPVKTKQESKAQNRTELRQEINQKMADKIVSKIDRSRRTVFSMHDLLPIGKSVQESYGRVTTDGAVLQVLRPVLHNLVANKQIKLLRGGKRVQVASVNYEPPVERQRLRSELPYDEEFKVAVMGILRIRAAQRSDLMPALMGMVERRNLSSNPKTLGNTFLFAMRALMEDNPDIIRTGTTMARYMLAGQGILIAPETTSNDSAPLPKPAIEPQEQGIDTGDTGLPAPVASPLPTLDELDEPTPEELADAEEFRVEAEAELAGLIELPDTHPDDTDDAELQDVAAEPDTGEDVTQAQTGGPINIGETAIDSVVTEMEVDALEPNLESPGVYDQEDSDDEIEDDKLEENTNETDDELVQGNPDEIEYPTDEDGLTEDLDDTQDYIPPPKAVLAAERKLIPKSEKHLDVIAGYEANGAGYIEFEGERTEISQTDAVVLMRVMKAKGTGVEFTELLKDVIKTSAISNGTALFTAIDRLNTTVLDSIDREIIKTGHGATMRKLVVKEKSSDQGDDDPEAAFKTKEEILSAMLTFVTGGVYDERLSDELDNLSEREIKSFVRDAKKAGASYDTITSLFDVCEPKTKKIVKSLL